MKTQCGAEGVNHAESDDIYNKRIKLAAQPHYIVKSRYVKSAASNRLMAYMHIALVMD